MSQLKRTSTVPRTVALCYVRLSYTRDESDLGSPERQRANISAVCQQRGWTPEWYEDVDGHKSGTKEVNRPAWLALKLRLNDPDVVALVANDQARLHRKGYRIGALLETLHEKGIDLVYAAPGRQIDLSGPTGHMVATIIGYMDEGYAQDISQRQKDSVNYRKRKGIGVGMPPFGTKRQPDGKLKPSTDGAWLLPDGSFVAGQADQCPTEGALWKSYYQCAERMLTLYAENKQGCEYVAIQVNKEGYPFRARGGMPRMVTKDDARRVIRNWPEYAGLVLEKSSKWRSPHDIIVGDLNFNPDRAAFPLELLLKVGEVVLERAMRPRDHGTHKKDVSTYVLNNMVYCAHCDAIAKAKNDPTLQTRLYGSNGRYRHKEGITCTCTNRSVARDILESEFARLVKMFVVRPEAMNYMTELAIQASRIANPDAPDLETQKREAIALCYRKLAAITDLYESGNMPKADYWRKREAIERDIAHWQARTSETEKAALELAMCAEAVEKILSVWEGGTAEDKQGIAHSLFTRISFDVDTHRFTDFELKPWADRFLVLRAMLYEGDSARHHLVRDMLPEGFQTISRDYMGPTVAVILLVLNGSFVFTSIRVTSSIPPKTERNQEIIQRYLSGERALDLAQEFGISVRRVNKLIARQHKPSQQ